HFLLPDKDMVNYKGDKVIGKLVPEKLKIIDEWKKEFVKSFSKRDIEILKVLSDSIDKLWKSHIEARKRIKERTKDHYNLPGTEYKESTGITVKQKDNLKKELDYPFSPYKRLKLVMDYWCSLWFWPVEKAELLPTRDEFLLDLQMILTGSMVDVLWKTGQIDMFEERKEEPENKDLLRRFGFVDTDDVCGKVPRLQVVRETAGRIKFFHWELEFADLFFDRGGFDLIVGNPPWVRVNWNELGLLSDYDPLISLRKSSSSEIAEIRNNYLEDENIKSSYLGEYVELTGLKSFTSAVQNYPYLIGMKTNLYKCFITQSWKIGNNKGYSAFLHPEGVYDDPNGQELRKEINERLKYHFHFHNELSLFNDVHHQAKYSINIYSIQKCLENISYHIFNLFHPNTIKECFEHNGLGEVDGIKDKRNDWNIKGHKSRIIKVDNTKLKLFMDLYEGRKEDFLEAKLPSIHSEEIINVIEKFTNYELKWIHKYTTFFSTVMLHETYSQNEGLIKKNTYQPLSTKKCIISGPHFFVSTPFNKTPNEGCKNNLDYSNIDLSMIENNFLPKTNYIPVSHYENFLEKIPQYKFNNEYISSVNFYRNIHRKMLNLTSERTLIAAIIPPGTMHIQACVSTVFKDLLDLLLFNGCCSSIIFDFFVKNTGRANLVGSEFLCFPYITNSNYKALIRFRSLRLNSLTNDYQELWERCYNLEINKDSFAKKDSRLKSWEHLTTKWTKNCPIRSSYERRQALVELDALVALALDLTIEELLTIYRIQFPVLQQHERENCYDQKGLLVPNEVLKIAQKEGIDIAEPGNSVKYTDPRLYPLMEREYITPFDTCDREADMKQAYEYFKNSVVRSQ
ncbi:MAG: hypothetical protein ABRQ37_23280, partial [Candidatus Eremiobacterota bacterium]